MHRLNTQIQSLNFKTKTALEPQSIQNYQFKAITFKMYSACTQFYPTATDDYDLNIPQMNTSREYTINKTKRNPHQIKLKDA